MLRLPRASSQALLVSYIFFGLLSVLAICILVRLPRFFVLFKTPLEWREGYLLRRCSISNPSPTVSISLGEEEGKRAPSRAIRNSRGYDPPQLLSFYKPFRPFVRSMRARISPGFSFGQLLLLSVYFSVLAATAFYRLNPFLDETRFGWIAVSQLPFIFAFGQKSSLLGALFGFGYEKINFVHRFAGYMAVLASNVHGMHFLYKWSLNGTLERRLQVHGRVILWGLISLGAMDAFYFFSTPFIRGKAYNLFLRSHILSMMVVLPAIYLHKPATLPYILASAGLYTLDRLLRLVKSRITVAYIRALPELGVTRVEIPSINAGWRAGQHVRLRILTLQLGWFGWSEVHPFTIASASHSPEGLVLLCKRAGDWTEGLFGMAGVRNTEGDIGARINVVVEGPFGGPCYTIYSSFSAAVFMAGGSGIAYPLSVIQDLIQKDLKGNSHIKTIDLVWSVPQPSEVSPVLPSLAALIKQPVSTHFRVHLFYTRAPTTLSDLDLPPGITLKAGRPNFSKVLEDAIAQVEGIGSDSKGGEAMAGMVIGVCGPISLADAVSKAVSAIDPVKRDLIGGIEICEEVFGM